MLQKTTDDDLKIPRLEPTRKPQKAVLKPPNSFRNVSNYSHEARTIPTYVLAGIVNSHHKSNKSITAANEQPAVSPGVNNRLSDPFISSMDNNWQTFFQTVDSTPAYSEGILNKDLEALGDLPNLDGKWGGDERLKRCLNNEEAYYHDQFPVKKKWYQFALSSKSSNSSDTSSLSNNEYGVKKRSKAGYWMSVESRGELKPYMKKMFLTNQYVPLFFRILIIIATIIALSISVNIYKKSKRKVRLSNLELDQVSQQPSTIMAICVQSVALVYLLFITYDEFNSQPLGIRNPVEKLRLILLDLLFIIFSSANLSLSFNTLGDARWVCTTDEFSQYPKIEGICDYQKSLTAFLFIILTMWVVTFTISIMRVIERVSTSPGGL